MFENFKQFFSQINGVSAMAKIDNVKANVPADAVYVTLAAVLIVDSTSRLMSVEHNNFIPVTALADGENTPTEIAYVVHNGQELKLIRDQHELFSTPLSSIERLHRFGSGGFVLHLKNGQGIAFSTPTPVQTDTATRFRTIQGMTDMTGGWIKELEPLGIQVSD